MMFFVVLLVFQCCVEISSAADINDTESLHSALLQNYNKNVRPVDDQSKAIEVEITLYIKSIQELDEVNEKFSYVAALSLSWTDDKMKWNPADYGGLVEVTVSYNDVWTPELTLSSPADKLVPIGKSTDRIRFWADGTTQWMPVNLIESTCSVNAKHYPFDTQSCTTSFSSLGYKNYEVSLKAEQSAVAFDVYLPNALWDVVGSDAGTILLGSGGESEIFFTVKLKRKAAFVIINVLMPILVLSLLNVFVFVLVPESGERIGYCITTLLAIAVYMTIVSDMLPRTSEPVPLISFKLMSDIMISAIIVVVTICNMRISYMSDDLPIPSCMMSLYRCLYCSRPKTNKIFPEDNLKDSILVQSKNELRNDKTGSANTKNGHTNEYDREVRETPEEKVTWKKISNALDWIAFIVFTTISVGSFIAFVMLTKYGSM